LDNLKGSSKMARKTVPARPKKTPKAPVSDTVVDNDAPAVDPNLLKKPDLLDQVVSRTNLKKRDVKPAVEAALAVIGEALRKGNELALPPLGKVRLVKTKELDGGACVMTLKLRTAKHAAVAAVQTSDDD
jgi:nucleoid DNA-binding protein